MQFDRELVLNILERVQNSIEQILERSSNYLCGDDFLLTPTGMTILELFSFIVFMQLCNSISSLNILRKFTNKNRKDKEIGEKYD